jgi:hypothetical protein
MLEGPNFEFPLGASRDHGKKPRRASGTRSCDVRFPRLVSSVRFFSLALPDDLFTYHNFFVANYLLFLFLRFA